MRWMAGGSRSTKPGHARHGGSTSAHWAADLARQLRLVSRTGPRLTRGRVDHTQFLHPSGRPAVTRDSECREQVFVELKPGRVI